jgi:hypothetical protein
MEIVSGYLIINDHHNGIYNFGVICTGLKEVIFLGFLATKVPTVAAAFAASPMGEKEMRY